MTLLDKISISLFDPQSAEQNKMHDDILLVLTFVNFFVITATFLISPVL